MDEYVTESEKEAIVPSSPVSIASTTASPEIFQENSEIVQIEDISEPFQDIMENSPVIFNEISWNPSFF